jgi:hypothetical protein
MTGPGCYVHPCTRPRAAGAAPPFPDIVGVLTNFAAAAVTLAGVAVAIATLRTRGGREQA